MLKVHRHLTLLRVTPELLEELDARGTLNKQPHRAIGPGLLLIEREQVPELVDTLLEQGYLPRIERA